MCGDGEVGDKEIIILTTIQFSDITRFTGAAAFLWVV